MLKACLLLCAVAAANAWQRALMPTIHLNPASAAYRPTTTVMFQGNKKAVFKPSYSDIFKAKGNSATASAGRKKIAADNAARKAALARDAENKRIVAARKKKAEEAKRERLLPAKQRLALQARKRAGAEEKRRKDLAAIETQRKIAAKAKERKAAQAKKDFLKRQADAAKTGKKFIA